MKLAEVREAWMDLAIDAHRHDIRIVGSRCGVAVYRRPRWGLPGDAIQFQRADEPAEVSLARVRKAVEMLMKKPVRTSDGPVTVVPLHDGQSAVKWPKLWEQLTSTKYDDGDPREPSSLLIFLQDGSLKGMLREKNTAECLWMSARGLIPLFDCFEVELSSDHPDWRPDRKENGQKAPRKGKAT